MSSVFCLWRKVTLLSALIETFLYNYRNYVMNTLLNSNRGPFTILKGEATKQSDSLHLPDWINIVKDITG